MQCVTQQITHSSPRSDFNALRPLLLSGADCTAPLRNFSRVIVYHKDKHETGSGEWQGLAIFEPNFPLESYLHFLDD